LPKTPL
jgi:tetratricopeptide (TPR) repeat protein